MAIMIVEQSLLELLAIQMRCEYLSDLRRLTSAQRDYLAWKLEQITPRQEDLRDWNQALTYLTEAPEQTTAVEAKERLIALLSSSHGPDSSTPERPSGERS